MNGVAIAELQLEAVNGVNGEGKVKETSGVLPPLVSLKCNICGDYLNQPVSLQCLHSYCKTCLEKYNQDYYGAQPSHQSAKGKALIDQGEGKDKESKGEEPEAEAENLGNSPRAVICKVCTENLGMAVPSSPAAPFENARLERIVGLVESDNIVCQNCNDTTSEMKCNTCDAFLCVPCMGITHEAPIFKTHDRERLKHERMMAPPKCAQHPLNDLEFFSTEEEMGVCQVCLLKGEFVGKPYCLVADVRKLRQEDIEGVLEQVLDHRQGFLEGQEQAEEVIERLGTNLEEQTAAVKSNFASIRAALDKREKETLEALSSLKTAKEGVLKRQIEQTKNIIEVLDDGVANVDLVLNHSNDLELVYMTVVLQDFVSDLASLDAKRFKDGMLDMSYYLKPAVGEELPVILSDRVPQLVSAYASVPSSDHVQGVTKGNSMSMDTPMTKEQKKVLQEVSGDKANADGCVLQ